MPSQRQRLLSKEENAAHTLIEKGALLRPEGVPQQSLYRVS